MAPTDRTLRQILANWFSKPAERERTEKREQLEKLIKGFDAKEREAVEYIRWIKNKTLKAYAERVGIENRKPHPSVDGLQTSWESFVEFLDGYRHLKQYIRSVNRKHLETEIEKEEEKRRASNPEHDVFHLASLRKRILAYDDIAWKFRLIENELKRIENFFALMSGQDAVMRSGGSSKNFEKLLETDLPAVLSQIALTKDRLREDEAPPSLETAESSNEKHDHSLPPPSTSPTTTEPKGEELHYDLFLSHAFEDKDAIARPLYQGLVAKGVSVWFDEAVLQMGDSLRRSIDAGLARCRYGVVILSPKFLSKQWPQHELDGLVARETATGEKAILPIWHQLDRETLIRYSPPLADRLASRSEEGVEALVIDILRVLKK